MTSTASRTGNRLLDLLPEGESRRLQTASRTVFIPHGRAFFRNDERMPHVYFPTTVVFGIVLADDEGKQLEGTTIGNEGMVGLPVFLGQDFNPFTFVSQVPGEALQLPAAAFLQALRGGGLLDLLLRRYTLYRLKCAGQTGACNALHSVEKRMCRWLLMTHDRAGQDEFLLTHEFLAELLGVRRQSVSIIAAALQKAGLITYRRGILRIQDRQGLEAASCECYEVLKRVYHRVMGDGREDLSSGPTLSPLAHTERLSSVSSHS
jgi:CRP-like cAMP-binding protein